MLISLKNYIKDIIYKLKTVYDCDYDFYDIPIYLIDFEKECD